MARPPKSDDERLDAKTMVRMTGAQMKFLERAAAEVGSKPSPFMRETTLCRASEILGTPYPGQLPANEASTDNDSV